MILHFHFNSNFSHSLFNVILLKNKEIFPVASFSDSISTFKKSTKRKKLYSLFVHMKTRYQELCTLAPC